MQEFQLFEFADLALERAWSHLQWWAGISFGLIALANFASKKLNLVYVISLSILFAAFSYYTQLNLVLEVRLYRGFRYGLELLRDAGQLSPGGIRALGAYESIEGQAAIPLYTCFIGLLLAALGFLWATYFKARRSQ